MKKILAMVLVISLMATSIISLATAESKPYEGVELTWMIQSSGEPAKFRAVADAAEEILGMKVLIETFPGGEQGDNIVKTRLATGEMTSLLTYNTGSLLHALNPSEYFIDMTDKADLFDDSFVTAASVDGVMYGVPAESSQAGAIIYNQEKYKEYNLEIPLTWDDFLANCEVLKQAGETAIISASADSWTTQVTYLGDHYNVRANEPNFVKEFQAGEAKYATSPFGLESFQKIQDIIPYLNEDHMATTYGDGRDKLMEGEGVHWIMLTGVFASAYELYGDEVNKMGVFAIPGESADVNGLTVWPAGGLYVNKADENTEAALAFVDYYISQEGLDAVTSVALPNGPIHVKSYKMPENAFTGVKQMQDLYFSTGRTTLALEYETSVKGPNCAAICQELISGQTTAEQAAAKYDEDCKKQAVQLGLDWK